MLRQAVPFVRNVSRLFSSGHRGEIIHNGVPLHGPYVSAIPSHLANKTLLSLLENPVGKDHLQATSLAGGGNQAVFNALHRQDLGHRVIFYTTFKPCVYEQTVFWNRSYLPNKQLPIVPLVITDGEAYITPHPEHIESFLSTLTSNLQDASAATRSLMREITDKIKSVAESTNYNRPTPGSK